MEDNQRNLLILGASSDLGCELIRKVVNKYDIIIGHYNHMNDNLLQLKEQYPDKLQLLQADFSDVNSINDFISEIKDNNYHPAHIVHFAAPRFQYLRYEQASIECFESEMKTSLYSLVSVTQAFLPMMKKKRSGKVIVMLTICTQGTPPKFLSTYVTSKYAMLGLVKSLAADYADKGIQVNGVSPEMIETKFLDNIPDFVRQQNAESNPLKRNLTVEDVIPTFEYLLSDAADCITGQNICITGGK